MPSQLPLQDATTFKPEIAWTTIIQDVVMLSEFTYRITVVPQDVNELGAELAIKEVGMFVKDFVGVVFPIISVNVGGVTTNIIVEDTLKTGYGPQTGQPGIVFKSVGKGTSPLLAPVKNDKLDKSALDYSKAIELDILWKGQQASKFVFTGSNAPSITNYNATYADIYFQYPEVRLFTFNDGKWWERMEKPEFIRDADQLLTGVEYDLSEAETGYLILARA